jgi:hypothetical protein
MIARVIGVFTSQFNSIAVKQAKLSAKTTLLTKYFDGEMQ